MQNQLERGIELAALVSLDSMEGVLPQDPGTQVSQTRLSAARFHFFRLYPGVLACSVVGLAATWLSQHYGAPVMLFALLLGIALHFLTEEGRCRPGIEFCSRSVLRLGVALLGLRITLGQVQGLGLGPVSLVVAGVLTTMLFGRMLGLRLGLSSSFGLLSGGAVAICGASAAMAISTALPGYRERERDTILVVVGVTTLSTIAMVTYPVIAASIGLSNQEAGIFLGSTIHDVAQVVGAGYMISQETGDIATYVKLLRVAMLIPAVFFIAYSANQTEPMGARLRRAVPTFLLGFVALVLVNSFIAVPAGVSQWVSTVSSWCLVAAIAALGMKTSFGSLAKVGWKPLAAMVAETAWIGVLSLAVILVLR